ncbi:MAG: M43 family zinc metalloprotease [Sphingobacteriales bacterium JAD_PAG50586_3]|nr:MAG: M43 family zinc metalloprotease [Sphingobacteriales bacterium JAD_PAG50586_3]
MKVFYLLILSLFTFTLNAQTGQAPITSPAPLSQQPANNPPGCVTDLLHNLKKANNPAYAQQQQLMDNAIRNFAGTQRGGTITIPVVVHIIHNNGEENISDQQVLDGLFHLNLAFANISPYNTSNGVNTGIQFCLAQQDPNGEYTFGITRTVSTLTNMNAESEDLQLKNLIRWDPTRYLNIWLVKEITTFSMGSGVAGYAYFPSSHGQPEDGIVNEASLFGSSVNNSKVHIHEAGHYLGLYHTFEGGCTNNNCQTDGDRVCDTPPDNSTNPVLCAENPNTCSSDDDDLSPNNPFRPVANGGLGDQPDMFENYMDYGFQFCQNAFSQGQSTRMNSALNTSRASLLQSIGCNSICYSPINTIYTTSATTILYGGSVTFTVTYPANGITYTWAVNGVPFGTGTTVSRTFNNVGTYTITLTADNGQPACLGYRNI